jgi:hypothetical protein
MIGNLVSSGFYVKVEQWMFETVDCNVNSFDG